MTLIELMAVVVVVGILAAVATVGFAKYRRRAMAGEGASNVGLIAAAQESYKAEYFRYANVNALNPAAAPACGSRGTWSTAIAVWQELGWRPEERNIAFQYRADGGTDTIGAVPAWASAPSPACFPTVAADRARGWYAVEATADLACTGTPTTYRMVHCTSTLMRLNEDQ